MLKLEFVSVRNFMQACVTSQSTSVVLQAETGTSQMKNLIAYNMLQYTSVHCVAILLIL